MGGCIESLELSCARVKRGILYNPMEKTGVYITLSGSLMAKLDMTADADCSLNHTHGTELLAVAGERADARRLCEKCGWVFLPFETLAH